MPTKIIIATCVVITGLLSYNIYALSNTSKANNSSIINSSVLPTDPQIFKEIRALDNKITQLEKTIEDNSQYQQQLEDNIDQLEHSLQKVTLSLSKLSLNKDVIAQLQSPQSQEPQPITAITRTEQTTTPEEKLLAYGFEPGFLTQIKTQQDQYELDRLYLRDKAVRENWIDSPRYSEEVVRLSQTSTLRNKLGEERYDQYLFAIGEDNRIVVDNIIAGSSAEQVGINPGDTIISYDGKRIFNWSEIREATLAGSTGELTTIEVERNQQRLKLSIARGPLGVRLNTVSVEPTLP